MPTPESTAKARIIQYSVAKLIAETDSAISSVPPTRNPRAPYLSTQNPTGVCNAAVVPLIKASDSPSMA